MTEPPRNTPDEASQPAFGRSSKPKRGRPQRRSTASRIWNLIVVGAVAAILVAVAVGAVLVKQFLDGVPQVPDAATLETVNQSPGMTFEDQAGAVIATRGPKHGSMATLAELPPYVPRAFLAAEDRRFYQHGPVDVQGIARAIWVNWRAGHTVQGASTLTQQLARSLFLTPAQTLRRKLQEAVIAYRLEQEMSKDQVLELYLNRIFFGDNAYGIDAASQTYFGKPAKDMDLQEAALLAALPKAPTRLALTNDMDAAVARSRLVLAAMHEEGWITGAQEQDALAHPPTLAAEQPGEGDFGYVLDMAAAQAEQIAGRQAPDLVVRLTVDSSLQQAAQGLVAQTLGAEGGRLKVSQGSLVLLAPDGAIRALVGGRDHRLSAFNRAVQAERQPGSSFKPFVYAAALENGVKPTDVRQDAPIRIGMWSPGNYGGGYRGAVTVADALAHSINTVSVRLASELGGPRIAELAHRFGLKTIPDDPQLSIALGAYEVNLLELASAYQVFQQGGQRVDPYLIEQISTDRGDVLFSHVAGSGPTVYDAGDAGLMVRMLEGVITSGTGTRAAFGRPAAGKTGTSQDWKDAWFVGFTPDWLCGVWVGNDDGTPTRGVTGGELPAEIWRKMMIIAHQNIPIHDFALAPPAPSDTVADEGAPASGEPALAGPAAKTEFYNGLSDDFGRAAAGDESDDAGPDEDQPPPDARDGGYDGPPPDADIPYEGRRPPEEDGPPPPGPPDDDR